MKLLNKVLEKLNEFLFFDINKNIDIFKNKITEEHLSDLDELSTMIQINKESNITNKNEIEELTLLTQKLIEKDNIISEIKSEWEYTINNIQSIILLVDVNFNIKKVNKYFSNVSGIDINTIINKNMKDVGFFSCIKCTNSECPIVKKSFRENVRLCCYNEFLNKYTDVIITPYKKNEDIVGYVIIITLGTLNYINDPLLVKLFTNFNTEEYLIITASNNSKIVFVNKKFIQTTGYKYDDIIDTNIETIITNVENIKYVNEEEMFCDIEIKNKDNNKNIYKCVMKEVKNTDGEILHYIFFNKEGD